MTKIQAVHAGEVIDVYRSEEVEAEVQIYRSALDYMSQYNGRSVGECMRMAREDAREAMREIILASTAILSRNTGSGRKMPTCKHCGAPIVSYGGIWRHASDPDHEVWCGSELQFHVEPS
jgi:hypothetical protein